MNTCIIYYGMSGTLKLTTIESLHRDSFKVLSDTKPFFKMDEDYFNWSSRPNDAHLAIHRVLTLRLPGYLPSDRDIVIERGVTDNLFCVPNRGIPGLMSYDDMDITGLVKLESDSITEFSGCSTIIKKLIIMTDKNFINNKVLTNKYRRAIYPNVDSYLKSQDKYVEFTNRYNNINEIIVIDDAVKYITSDLNIDYE